MTNSELYLAAKGIINLVIPNLTVIKAYQSKRAPSGPYAVVSVFDSNETRYVPLIDLSNTDPVSSPIGDVNNVLHDVKQQLVTEISVNFYRDNANQHARDMLDANWRPDVHEYLLSNKLGWERNDPIANLSAEMNGKYEERAKLIFYLMHEESSPQTTNAIYSAQVILEEDDNEIANVDITSNS